MKELSIEEKAKRYDDRLEKARKWYDANTNEGYKGIFEDIFPELKESEDERIMKALINKIKCLDEEESKDGYSFYAGDYTADDCIAWLEKQGKPIDKIVKMAMTEKQRVLLTETNGDANIDWDTRSLQDVKLLLEYGLDYIKKLEKQGEQKLTPIFRIGDTIIAKDGTYIEKEPFHIDMIEDDCYWDGKNTILVCNQDKFEIFKQKPADKVEPRFKVGDWITNGIDVYKIKNIDLNEFNYIFENGISDISLVDNICHLWTIQDVKDGDVLFTSSTASHETFIFKSIDEKGNVECYFAYDSEDGFRDGKYHFIGRATNCKPATKEQRDLLFQKMKEAGYGYKEFMEEVK